MLTDSSSIEDRHISDKQNFNGEDSLSPLLPRSAWNSNLAYLKAIFRVKKILDEIEYIKE